MKAAACLCVVVLAGCGTSRGPHPYLIVNDNCNCEFYRLRDEKVNVTYSFNAAYSVNGSVSTRITLLIQNNNADTLDLSLAYVRVSSRNVPYRYNGKSLPVTVGNIPPGQQRTITLVGEVEEPGGGDPWLAIAGEELVMSIEGVRVSGSPIAAQTVQFVPHNPKLSP